MKLLKILLPLCCFALSLAMTGPVATNASLSPAFVTAAAQESDKLVYADFETIVDNRPVSSRGGVVQLFKYQESPASQTRLKGAGDTNAPEVVRLNKDDPNRAVAFDYGFQPPNQWAGAGLEVHGLPDKDGKPVSEDVTRFKYLTLQLYVTGAQSVTVEFISKGQGISIDSGSPQMTFKVSKGFNTYKVKLDSLGQPSYVEQRINPKDLLKKLTSINVNVSCNQCTPLNGTVVIDNLVFQN